jgi:hypothetical protein
MESMDFFKCSCFDVVSFLKRNIKNFILIKIIFKKNFMNFCNKNLFEILKYAQAAEYEAQLKLESDKLFYV